MNNLTPEQVRELSDNDLRMHLIELIYPNQQDEWYESFIAANNGDYCNNWNDLIPLVLKYGEDISNLDTFGLTGFWNLSSEEHPKRLLAKFLLKVLQKRSEP